MPARHGKGACSPDVSLVGCRGGLEDRFEIVAGAVGLRAGSRYGFEWGGVGLVVVRIGIAPLKWGQGVRRFFRVGFVDCTQVDSTRLELGGGGVEGR